METVMMVIVMMMMMTMTTLRVLRLLLCSTVGHRGRGAGAGGNVDGEGDGEVALRVAWALGLSKYMRQRHFNSVQCSQVRRRSCRVLRLHSTCGMPHGYAEAGT